MGNFCGYIGTGVESLGVNLSAIVTKYITDPFKLGHFEHRFEVYGKHNDFRREMKHSGGVNKFGVPSLTEYDEMVVLYNKFVFLEPKQSSIERVEKILGVAYRELIFCGEIPTPFN